jgi:hypothetical protein
MRLFTCLFSLFLILAFARRSSSHQILRCTPRPSGPADQWAGRRDLQSLRAAVGWAPFASSSTFCVSNQSGESMFRSGEARWLGIQPEHEPELPRVLLVSAPYALKAADAESPAIVTNGSGSSLTSETTAIVTSGSSSSAVASAVGTIPVTTAGGTVNLLAKFDAAADITKSLIFDNGTNVGIGNTAPAAKLDVSGSGIFRGFLQLPATSTANSTTKGYNSQPFDFLASVFNGTTAVNQHFRCQAEPVNPGLTTASGKLDLLFASGTGTPAETGLSIANNGRISFASGQTFPGTGTITGVIAGTDLTGGGNTGNVTLNLDTTKVAQLVAANTFIGNQTLTGNVTASSQVQVPRPVTTSRALRLPSARPHSRIHFSGSRGTPR